MGKYFGTDGFRGEVGVVLLPTHAYELGRFFGWYTKEKQGRRPRCVIAMDTRISGGMLEGALSAGLCASGADAHLLGVAPTPALAYLVKACGYDFGIMLSASHNPFYDNGIKVFNENGEKPNAEFLSLAEDYLDGKLECFGKRWDALPLMRGEEMGRVVSVSEKLDLYVEYLKAFGAPVTKSLKIGLDCANGATAAVAERLYRELGLDVVIMAKEPDGVNINTACGSTHPEKLCAMVKELGLDLAFAFDGDGDRCLAVDENGNMVDGDDILYLLGKDLKAKGRLAHDTIVATVMSNGGLAVSLARDGIGLVRTSVGDANVYAEMREKGYVLGGEQSGHIILSDYATTGDGLLTSLAVLACVGTKPLSEAAGFPRFAQILVNVPLKRRGLMKDPVVAEAVSKLEARLGEGGRILVRESGTEPLMRIMAECADAALCEAVVAEAKTLLENAMA